ncbi:ATP-binding cassette domain-containing protein [Sphaerotilus mobilis]|uniref:Zinc/manganese transport system ATP-binding protein n=1 Tax=Sphaerotilus mobilis TaxID=47994 RepID=A0A4Q7LFH1_9BURK|nr:ATP-binding cassette domain-containing protein [Sphaerotilus mobilis]RZS53216.1 zinc/manganese transport system ATP-binding protein [Sphaerotilus mobilis]
MSARRLPATVTLHDLALAPGGRSVLAGLSGRFMPGSATAVLGPNGVGKSTLLAALAGRLAPAAGRIERAAGRLAELTQADAVDRRFPITLQGYVATGLWPLLGAWRGIGVRERQAIAQTLDRLDLGALAGTPLIDLSAGQWQRARLARLWLQDAELLLLDEPDTALDRASSERLDALLREALAVGRTVVAVLHGRHEPPALYDEVLALQPDPDGGPARCRSWGPVHAPTPTTAPTPAPMPSPATPAAAWARAA